MKISIVIPAYNEEHSIGPLVKELQDYLLQNAVHFEYEIIVVDDGSKDKTAEIVDGTKGIKVIHHRFNKGYGAALKTGILNASGEIVITMDSDGQHNPKDIGRLLQDIEKYEMIVGARSQGSQSPLWRLPGKWILSRLVNYLVNEKIPDFNCGFRAAKRNILIKYLHLCPDGFSFSTTLTLAFFCQGRQVKFVPIKVNRRTISRSIVNMWTGLETLLLVMRLIALFGPLKLFLPTSFLFVLLGVIWGGRYVILGKGLSVAGLLFLLTGIMLFFFGLLTDQIAALRRERYE